MGKSILASGPAIKEKGKFDSRQERACCSSEMVDLAMKDPLVFESKATYHRALNAIKVSVALREEIKKSNGFFNYLSP